MTTVASIPVQKKRAKFRTFFIATASVVAIGLVQSSAIAAASDISFNIPSQSLADALVEFSRQSGVNVLAPFALVSGKRAPVVSGSMGANDALSRLLAGSGLRASTGDDGVVTILQADQGSRTAAGRPASRRPVGKTTRLDEAKISGNEILITGSHIIREGYEAPTPLTVVGMEQIQAGAAPNMMTFLNSLPVLSGNGLTTSTQICTACGTAGLQNLNLRSLGANRALVLLDGQRVVGASYNGVPDIGSLPQQLVSRVDVVTGGASAVYGSDAVAGVVNFILDRKFTGVKGEISGGLTNYGDDKNYKIDLTTGFGLADDRAHVLLSGEHLHNQGVQGDSGRAWNRTGFQQINNPLYTPTNGLPSQLIQFGTGLATATPGGIIVSGPLKGTAFGAGGVPFRFNYGPIYSNPYMVGGDWQTGDLRPNYDLDPKQTADNLFLRVDYDVTDNINVFVQYGWSQNHLRNAINNIWMLGGVSTSPIIQIDNAYLPTSVRAAMAANNITSFQLGTQNQDLGTFKANNVFIGNRFNTGLEGAFDAFETRWHWSVYYAYGSTKQDLQNPPGLVLSLYKQAIDAVINPATGQIVCRSTLTYPANGCNPWNVLGVGVNTSASVPSFLKPDYQYGLIQQQTFSSSIIGEPFSLPTGPVSLAIGFEHRKDEINSQVDQYSRIFDRPVGNFAPLTGTQSVTEGSLEILIPIAKDERWAKNWDLSMAARFTGYELSGYVTTYKLGTTYTPIDDVKLRVTRSRDIRAPNLQELFASPNATAGTVIIDRFLNNQQYAVDHQFSTSNPQLSPEKADTTGIGVVLSPRYLENFTMSVDYWDVNINGAILALTSQQVIDSCYTGQRLELCANIMRNAQGFISGVTYFPINLATQDMSGFDIEASYHLPISDMVAGWRGHASLHGLMTIYRRNYQNNTFNAPSDHVGENGGNNLPYWKLDMTGSYSFDPLTVSLTARAISSGRVNSEYIQCTSGCPASTTDHQTINYNRIAGRFYLDANIVYKLTLDDAVASEVFFSVKNMFNNDPPPVVSPFYTSISGTSVLYDPLGAVYRAGIRFKI